MRHLYLRTFADPRDTQHLVWLLTTGDGPTMTDQSRTYSGKVAVREDDGEELSATVVYMAWLALQDALALADEETMPLF